MVIVEVLFEKGRNHRAKSLAQILINYYIYGESQWMISPVK